MAANLLSATQKFAFIWALFPFVVVYPIFLVPVFFLFAEMSSYLTFAYVWTIFCAVCACMSCVGISTHVCAFVCVCPCEQARIYEKPTSGSIVTVSITTIDAITIIICASITTGKSTYSFPFFLNHWHYTYFLDVLSVCVNVLIHFSTLHIHDPQCPYAEYWQRKKEMKHRRLCKRFTYNRIILMVDIAQKCHRCGHCPINWVKRSNWSQFLEQFH